MRKLLKRIEAALAAVAFAEEGEVETARELLAEDGREPRRDAPGRRPATHHDVARPRIARLP